MPVDVNIIDKTGRPVKGLVAGDFALTIDGKPRRIASAQYIPASQAPAAPDPVHYSTNVSGGGGRQVMIVVDQGNIGAGRGKLALEAASRFVGTLGPADRIAVVGIPGAGPQVDFTSNRAVVQAMLPRLIGQSPPSHGEFRVGLAEAANAQQGDRFAMEQVYERECAGLHVQAEIEQCHQRLMIEANSVYQAARQRTQNTLVSLRFLIERMAANPSPKTIVFISEGLVLERNLGEVSWLGPLAARSQAVLYVLHLETPGVDVASANVSPSRNDDMALGDEGLSMLAGLTRGSVFQVVSTADSAFGRLGLEISGYYLLGFEPEAGDRNGKVHKIKIEVPGKSGIEIRSRSQFTIEPPRAQTDESALVEMLRAPLLSTDIGLKLSTYTLRDPKSGKLRVPAGGRYRPQRHGRRPPGACLHPHRLAWTHRREPGRS